MIYELQPFYFWYVMNATLAKIAVWQGVN